MKVLVIVPAYNEELNIKLVQDNLEKAKKDADFSLDYIVINDGSSDGTERVCEENNIPVINLVHNLGIGGAMQTGYIYAYRHNYDIAIQFDGDNQHDAKYIKNLVKEIVDNDMAMVIGSRYVGNLSSFKSSLMRRFGIRFLSFILKLTTGVKIYDMTSGFRAVNREVMQLFATYYPHDYPEPETITQIIKKGYKVKEIPVMMHERKFGTSSITPLKSLYYMVKVSYAMIVRSILERNNK